MSRLLGKPKIFRMTGLTNTEASPQSPPPAAPKLLDRLRADLRTRHYSIRTEQAYVDWVRRFVLFHNKRHPVDMGAAEVAAFLTHLAVDRQVSASTQNQAKSAILYLYKSVLNIDLPWLGKVVQAKAPAHLLEGSWPTEALLAQIAVFKHSEHMPLNRQAVVMARHGVPIDRSVLADWMGRTGALIAPVVDHMAKRLMAESTRLYVDETTAPVLDPGKGKTKTGYLWAVLRDDRGWGGTAPPGVVFHYRPGRKGEYAAEILEGFNGTIQVDAYGAYTHLATPKRTGGDPLRLKPPAAASMTSPVRASLMTGAQLKLSLFGPLRSSRMKSRVCRLNVTSENSTLRYSMKARPSGRSMRDQKKACKHVFCLQRPGRSIDCAAREKGQGLGRDPERAGRDRARRRRPQHRDRERRERRARARASRAAASSRRPTAAPEGRAWRGRP